jgi:hypothetical protein
MIVQVFCGIIASITKYSYSSKMKCSADPRQKENIKISADLREIGCEDVNGIQVVQDRVQC